MTSADRVKQSAKVLGPLVLVFVNMGPYGRKKSKLYSYKSERNVLLKHLLNFLPNGPHKNNTFSD